MNVLEWLKMKAVVPYNSGHAHDLTMPETLVGLELEIEKFPPDLAWEFGGCTFTEDNSLRDGGKEIILKPMKMQAVPALITALYRHFGITDRNYSERCSTHVHVNGQDMTLEQLAVLSLVYQTTERLLFQWVGHDRMNNIFCVPWHQSGLTYSMVNTLLGVRDHAYLKIRQWQKYSALNLLPLSTQGTVEFRHLHGTCDVNVITTWLRLLGRLVSYAKQTPFEAAKDQIVNMNTVSNYRAWLVTVFGTDADHLMGDMAFETALARGVIDSKVMLTTTPKPDKKAASAYNFARFNEQGVIGNVINNIEINRPDDQWPTFAVPEPEQLRVDAFDRILRRQADLNAGLNAIRPAAVPRPDRAPRTPPPRPRNPGVPR
jgi:hypothetical protein